MLKRHMNDEEKAAQTYLDNELTALRARWPKAGLTFGYIGNIWQTPYEDDRLWMFFLKDQGRGLGGHGAWGRYETEQLPEMARRVREGEFDKWLRKIPAIQ